MQTRVYLDWNATAPLLDEVREAMVECLQNQWGNASSIHMEGQTARSIVERARRAVAKAIGAPAQSVILTGGATESNNQIIRDFVRRFGKGVACSAIEHPSVTEVVEDLDHAGVYTATILVDSLGRLDWEQVRNICEDEEIGLVSVMLANNEIGNVFDISRLVEIAHDHDTLVHTDATQALGRIPIDFGALGVDLMSLSFHKMGGPKGIGAIVVREGLKVEATMSGGHQERGRRPGTENVPAAAGLRVACELVAQNLGDWTHAMEANRQMALDKLSKIEGFEVRGDQESRLPNTINFAISGMDGEDLLLALDLGGLALSSGSACTAGSLEPSHVVLAMGFEQAAAKESVRLSFGPTTSREDIERACDIIAETVDRLSRI